jgi:hypothetical protein
LEYCGGADRINVYKLKSKKVEPTEPGTDNLEAAKPEANKLDGLKLEVANTTAAY